MNRKYRFIAALLILSMVITVFPETALAEDLENQDDRPAVTEEVQMDSESEPQKNLEEAASDTEDLQDEDLTGTDLDDPGRGRLSGQEIPAEFYAGGIQTRAASKITHNSRFAGYTIKQGIDVSKWNNTINWTAVRNAGIEFAFIRTSYRGTETGKLAKDPTAPANMVNANNAGVKIGAYIFSQAITVEEAVEEADYLLQTVQGYNITMPLVFDFEYYSGGRLSSKTKLTKRERTDICLAFCDRVKQAGYTPLVYANKSMFSSDLYASEITSKYPAWLAHYTTKTDYAGDYDFWQYTSTGSVSGISGNVDMNFWYIKPGTNVSFGTGGVSLPGSDTLAAPAVPKVSAKASGSDAVKLSWDKVAGATGYLIYRYNTSTGKYERIKKIESNSTVSYTDTGRSAGTTYQYKVKSYKKKNGQTAISSAAAVSATTESAQPVQSVQSVSKTGKTNGTGIVVRSGPDTSYKKLKTLGINTSVSITGTIGSWYRISIKISGKTKTGYIKKTYVTVIGKPSLSASAASKSKIKLKWKKISGASGYQIQRYNSSKKKYVTVKTVKKGATTSYTNTGLKKNKKYKYRMRAYKTVRGNKIYSSFSSVKSAKTKK